MIDASDKEHGLVGLFHTIMCKMQTLTGKQPWAASGSIIPQ
jgi:hypothetical protein